MRYSLQIRNEALFELKEAFVWYEKKQKGLGKEFRSEVNSKIDKVLSNPYHYQCAFENIHEAIIKRFPYIVV